MDVRSVANNIYNIANQNGGGAMLRGRSNNMIQI